MLTLVFYLAVATIFLKGKPKKIIGLISVGLSSMLLLLSLSDYLFHYNNKSLWKIVLFLKEGNPLYWLFYYLRHTGFKLVYHKIIHVKTLFIITDLLEYITHLTLAFVSMKININYEKISKKGENDNIQEKNTEDNEVISKIPSEYKPISMWGYFGYEILFSIPLIGWILLIWKALSAKNKNLKNFARSYFCLLIIALVEFILLFIIYAKEYADLF